MRRIRLVIEYDGTSYVGWQVQPNGVSIQEKLNEALLKITKEPIQVHGSGRTDSGVHARAQVGHFDTNVRMDASKFSVAMNSMLPRDIRILYSEEVSESFHSRFSAKEKTYLYTIQQGPYARVLTRNTALHIHHSLDLQAMQCAAKSCIGEHDFRAFMSTGRDVSNTVRTLSQSEWIKDGPFLYYVVTGNGFLYNMVRILVGTMIEIGMRRMPDDSIEKALLSFDRRNAGPTAPAHGLTLMRVRYPDFDTDEVLKAFYE